MGIFAFYDENGYVNDYIDVLLSSLEKVIQRLVIVVSGQIAQKSYIKLQKHTKDIFIRENLGYDAGAYKDIFTKFLLSENWEKWDEVILFNDTFYAPLNSWEAVFEKMKSDYIDFWGLSKHPGGEKLSIGKDIPAHIQGYFLVCKKALILSLAWKKFWDNLSYPIYYWDAVEKFEINFSVYFTNHGFCSGAYTDKISIEIEIGKNPYLNYIEELVKNYRFPVIKRKVICLEHLNEAKKTIKYIEKNTDYNISLIYDHIRRLCKEGRMNPIEPFNSAQLEQFYHVHKRVFIYGHGAYGKGLSVYFEYRNWKYEGFIVSEQKEKNEDTFVYRNMQFTLEDGIILALGKEAFTEVYPKIKNDFPNSQLCCPSYDL